jgi:hypothetical protein
MGEAISALAASSKAEQSVLCSFILSLYFAIHYFAIHFFPKPDMIAHNYESP